LALGNAYVSLGRTDQSLSFHSQALDHFLETVGADHLLSANAKYKMACHQMSTQEYDKAM